MLAEIGVDAMEDLFAPIPSSVRFPTLALPPVLTELEAADRLGKLAAANLHASGGNSFLGAGSYNHYIPATVGQILSRGEFYTAYTPYQPEVAQGTLQVIYEFQSMVASLLGTDVANASMYDGATALAEAVLMAAGAHRKQPRVVISGTVHPHYIEVVRTYCSGLPIELDLLPIPAGGFVTSTEMLAARGGDDVAAFVIQYPSFFGGIEAVEAAAELARGHGASLVVATSPVPLALLKPPGQLGAEIVTAEGQPLGVAQSFGGPYVGLLGTQRSYLRQMPGRLAGVATDSEGKRGFVLTLQTREQHIRREKATSNICTNQGLMATAATVYMSSLGPEGFREVARRSYQNAHYLAERLTELPGYRLALDGEFFHEFVVETPVPVAEINGALRGAGIIGGYDLGRIDPALERRWLICATELNDKSSVDRLIASLPN
jgi:glycine dehydrogenase subunit 1